MIYFPFKIRLQRYKKYFTYANNIIHVIKLNNIHFCEFSKIQNNTVIIEFH